MRKSNRKHAMLIYKKFESLDFIRHLETTLIRVPPLIEPMFHFCKTEVSLISGCSIYGDRVIELAQSFLENVYIYFIRRRRTCAPSSVNSVTD